MAGAEAAGTLRPHTHSQAHTLLNDSDPGVPVVSRCRVDLIHLGGRRADQKHPFLLVGNVPNDEVLQRYHGRLVLSVRGKEGLSLGILILGYLDDFQSSWNNQRKEKSAHST